MSYKKILQKSQAITWHFCICGVEFTHEYFFFFFLQIHISLKIRYTYINLFIIRALIKEYSLFNKVHEAESSKKSDLKISCLVGLFVSRCDKTSLVSDFTRPWDNLFKSRPSGFRYGKCNAIVIPIWGSVGFTFCTQANRTRRVPGIRTINRSAMSLKDCYFAACNRI